MIELKKCPCCGGEPESKQRGNSIRYFVVKCQSCGLEAKGKTEEDSRNKWNRRIESPRQTEENPPKEKS